MHSPDEILKMALRALLIAMAITLGAAGPSTKAPSDTEELRLQLIEANRVAAEIAKRLLSARQQGNALTELEALRAMQGEFSSLGEIPKQVIGQELAVLSSRLGNYSDAIRYDDLAGDLPSFGDTLSLEGFVPRDGVATLAEVADTSQVIMINEAHHVPEHRAFSLRLLPVLRQEGFSYLAVESLFAEDVELGERGYPTSETGAYTSEPVFGEMIRVALRLGFKVVAYESAGGGTEARERGQAVNLMERILRLDPKAKVLVHAGYSHINESGTLAGARPMAVQFRELTGIDPFTVDQITMMEHSSAVYEHPVYRRAMESHRLNDATIFRQAKSIWSAAPGRHDATVFHPRTRFRAGRPNWLRLAGARCEYRLSRKYIKRDQHYLVFATRIGEARNAVPVDQVEVAPKKPLPVLLLPSGSHLIRVGLADGNSVSTFSASCLAKPLREVPKVLRGHP